MKILLGIIVAIGLALPAFGQSSLREQLVGAWTVVSCPNPTPRCAKPNGVMILDASGAYAAVNAARDRPKFTRSVPSPREAQSAEEYKAAAAGVQANWGTWSVNEADKTITWHANGALFPNVEGMDFKSGTVSISGDELKAGTAVWQRVKK